MDPADKHDLLITFCNRGGAIERIELTTRSEDGAFASGRAYVIDGAETTGGLCSQWAHE